MANDEKKQEQELEDEEFMESLLNPEEEETEESKEDDPKKDKGDESKESKEETKKDEEEDPVPQKNKDAEAARKRREAEAKAKEDAKKKADAEKKEKEQKEDSGSKGEGEGEKDESKAKGEDDKKASANQQRLGEELTAFKRKYPDVDLGELDEDKNFKKYIKGKLLGDQDFTALYEEYLDFRSDVSNVDKEAIAKNHRKAKSSSGPSKGGPTKPTDVYSQNELEKMATKLPFLPRKEAQKVEEKLERSIAFYEKN